MRAKRCWLIILLLTLLNHAVLACDSVVAHWPQAHHNISGLAGLSLSDHRSLHQLAASSDASPRHQHCQAGHLTSDPAVADPAADHTDTNQTETAPTTTADRGHIHTIDEDDAEPHGHVLCFVAYLTLPLHTPKIAAPADLSARFAPALTFAPPVPPPNC